MGRPHRRVPVACGAHGVLRHPRVLLHDRRHDHRVRSRLPQRRLGRLRLALQACGPVGGTTGLASVLGVAHRRVQRGGGGAQSQGSQTPRLHGAARFASRARRVRVRASVLREQHAVCSHGGQVPRRFGQPDRRRVVVRHEHAARALGHGHPPAHPVRGLCGPHHPVRVRHRGACRERSLQGVGGALAALRAVLVAVPRHRHRLGRRVGLRRARLGRLLGLGSRREREPSVVARGRGAHPQFHGVPPARRVQALVGDVRVPDVRVRHRGHVHLAFGACAVGARLRGRSGVARAVRRAHRPVGAGRHRGVGRAVEKLRPGRRRFRRRGEHGVEGRRLLLQQRHHGGVHAASDVPDRGLGAALVVAVGRADRLHRHLRRHRAPARRGVPGHLGRVPAPFVGPHRRQAVLEARARSGRARARAVRSAHGVLRDVPPATTPISTTTPAWRPRATLRPPRC